MIRPISQSVNFYGSVRLGANGRSERDVQNAIANIQEPDRDTYLNGLNKLKENLEEKTASDAQFAIDVKYSTWNPGNSSLKYGKQLELDIYDLKHSGEAAPIYRAGLPIINNKGNMWSSGDKFEKDVNAFVTRAFNTVMRKHALWEVLNK